MHFCCLYLSTRVQAMFSPCLLIACCYPHSQNNPCQIFAEGECSRFKTHINQLEPVWGIFSRKSLQPHFSLFHNILVLFQTLTFLSVYPSNICKRFFSPSKYLVRCSFLTCSRLQGGFASYRKQSLPQCNRHWERINM